MIQTRKIRQYTTGSGNWSSPVWSENIMQNKQKKKSRNVNLGPDYKSIINYFKIKLWTLRAIKSH